MYDEVGVSFTENCDEEVKNIGFPRLFVNASITVEPKEFVLIIS